VTEAQELFLRQSSARCPLSRVGGAVSWGNGLSSSDQAKFARELFRQLPENSLVAGLIGFVVTSATTQYLAPLEALSRKYPSNYLIASALMMAHFGNKNYGESRKVAERIVKLSPQNPDAWMSLGTRYADEAQNV